MKLWLDLKRWYLGTCERQTARRRVRDAKQLPREASEKERKLAVERDAKLVGLLTPNGG